MKEWIEDIIAALSFFAFVGACIYLIPLGFFLITGTNG
jgi:hypothetical protein